MKCMRVGSIHPCQSGGWYHFYNEVTRPIFTIKSKPPPRAIDADAMITEWQCNTTRKQIDELAEHLGVQASSLLMLGAAFSPKYKAWAFPMLDGDGKTIGIRLRNSDGFKWAVSGSRQGIFTSYEPGESRIAFLPEGPTDTAAILSMGLFAIGRPTCNSGTEHVKAALERLRIYEVVIVADNDEMKKLGPREGRPGIEGAQKLKRDLGLRSCIYYPTSPCKDVRQLVGVIGPDAARRVIESDIKQKVWSKK